MEYRCSLNNGQVIRGSCDYRPTYQCRFYCNTNYRKTGSNVYCNNNELMWRTKDGDPCIADRNNNFLTSAAAATTTTTPIYWPAVWNASVPKSTFSAYPRKYPDEPTISTLSWNQNLFLSVVVGGLMLLIVALILMFVCVHRKIRRAQSERNAIEYSNQLCSEQELIRHTCETENAPSNLQISLPPPYVDLQPPTYEYICSLAENENRSFTSGNETQMKSNAPIEPPPPYVQ